MADNGGKKVSPTIVENIINQPFTVNSSERIVFDGRNGSSFPALAGYVLNNQSSGTVALTIQLRKGSVIDIGDPIVVDPADTVSFFAVGADNIVAVADTAASVTGTGNLQFSLNYNPL